MSEAPPPDVVVVGLGAAGGLAASQLAQAGFRVVGLEAGDWHSAPEFALDDLAQLSRNGLGAVKVNREVPTIRSAPDETARQPMITTASLMMNGVGGSKTHSTNISWRMLLWNFRARTSTEARYGPDAVPAGSTLVDWPFGYDDLEPYYSRIEELYGISGTAGNIDGVPTGRGNPFEGTRSSAYPSPPLRRSAYTELMAEAARRLGWAPFETPASIRTSDQDGKRGCTYCGHCTWNGCWVDAKAVPSSIGLPEALETGNLEVRTRCRVLSIDIDESGAANGVTYIDADGNPRHQPARIVILATFTYENTRLLLTSTSAAFPRGLANNSGQVGRHFMTHSFVMGFGLFPGRGLNVWSGSNAQGAAIADFDGDNAAHDEFVGGGVIMAGHEIRPLLHQRFTPPDVPRWGAERKRWLSRNLGSIGWAYALPDELPYEDHYLDLDPAVKDDMGVPVIRVTQSLKPNEQRMYGYLADRMRDWFMAAGAAEYWHTRLDASPISTHSYGGTRMGEDPATSVVGPDGMAHEVPNLMVLGASTFPTSGGVNPTETVEAVTLMMTERLIARGVAR